MAKKQNVVSKSSAKVEYRSIAQTVCKVMWLIFLLVEFGFTVEVLMSMRCDNQTTIFIIYNPIFYEHTKHIEIDCHFVRNLVMKGIIAILYTPTFYQFADIFTK